MDSVETKGKNLAQNNSRITGVLNYCDWMIRKIG